MKGLRRIWIRTVRGCAAVAACVLAAATAGSASNARAASGAAAVEPAATGTGVVAVETNLAYQGAAAAATGMVLSPSGQVLTNNHVIRGATTIRVVFFDSGRTYPARALGYDIRDDVALLQVIGAADLPTVALGNSSNLRVCQPVTACLLVVRPSHRLTGFPRLSRTSSRRS